MLENPMYLADLTESELESEPIKPARKTRRSPSERPYLALERIADALERIVFYLAKQRDPALRNPNE